MAHDWELSERVTHDGALAVSELVTNAVLHARTRVHVRVAKVGRGVRIEVEDGNPYLPPVDAARPEDLLSNRSMTGRGLALVAATCDRWGSESTEAGKVTWAEVGTGRRRRRDDAANGTEPTDDDSEGDFRVRLIGVPVAVLLESTRQLSDLQREMQVIGVGPDAPEDVTKLVEAAPEWFPDLDSWTDADRVLAESAAAAGQETVDFDFVVPEDVVRRIHGVGAWIDQAAAGIRRRDLLTMPVSPEVVAYRYWLAEEIVRQMAGGRPRPCPVRAGQQKV